VGNTRASTCSRAPGAAAPPASHVPFQVKRSAHQPVRTSSTPPGATSRTRRRTRRRRGCPDTARRRAREPGPQAPRADPTTSTVRRPMPRCPQHFEPHDQRHVVGGGRTLQAVQNQSRRWAPQRTSRGAPPVSAGARLGPRHEQAGQARAAASRTRPHSTGRRRRSDPRDQPVASSDARPARRNCRRATFGRPRTSGTTRKAALGRRRRLAVRGRGHRVRRRQRPTVELAVASPAVRPAPRWRGIMCIRQPVLGQRPQLRDRR